MFKLRTFVLIGTVFLLISRFSGAQINTIPQPSLDSWDRDSEVSGELDFAHTTILGITIGSHTIEDVKNIFGKTCLFKSDPNLNYAPSLVCYVAVEDSSGTSIIFESGPMGGWKRITAFIVGPKDGIPSYQERCGKSVRVNKEVTTKSGIRLDMSRSEIEAILGQPTHIDEKIIAYRYHSKKKMSEDYIESVRKKFGLVIEQPFWDVSSGIETQFRDGKLIWFRVYKAESS